MDSETELQRLLRVQDSIWVGQVNIGVDSTQLGVGSDATVYRTLYDGQNVAAKVLHPILISPGNPGRQAFIERFGEECLRLRQLSHPSVVSFIGVGQAPNKCPCLLTELMEESLASRINATPPDSFLQTLSYLIDMSAGLRYLHWLRLIHRDLKPANILITAGAAKIADVGLARAFHGDVLEMMSRCPGTPTYMAPETLSADTQYDEKIDIFSAGIIMVTLLTNQNPAPTPREIVIVGGRRVPTSELVRRRGDIARLDPKHPARPLIFRCISDDPSSRPSATELYQELQRIQHLFVGIDKVVLSSELTAAMARLNVAQPQQEVEQQLTETVTRLNDAEQELASTRQELASTREDQASTRQELASTREDQASTRQELASTRQELASTRQDQASSHQETKQNMTTLSSQHTETVARLTATQQQLTSTRQELASSRQDVTRLEETVQDLVASVRQLTAFPRRIQPQVPPPSAAALVSPRSESAAAVNPQAQGAQMQDLAASVRQLTASPLRTQPQIPPPSAALVSPRSVSAVAANPRRTSIERHRLCFDQRKCSSQITLSNGGKRAKYTGWFGICNITTTDGYTTGVSVLPRHGDYSTKSVFFGRSRAYYWNSWGDSFHGAGGVERQQEKCSKWNEGDVLTFFLNCEKSTLEVHSSSSHNTATITGLKLEEPLYPTVCIDSGGEVELC